MRRDTHRTFSCPARFLPMVNAAISLAIADARREEQRLARGNSPTLGDNLVDRSLTGDCVVQVSVLDREQQAQDAAWPDVVARIA